MAAPSATAVDLQYAGLLAPAPARTSARYARLAAACPRKFRWRKGVRGP